MSDMDANDCDKLKKALLTRYNDTEDGSGRSSQRLKKRQTPFVVHLKNYQAKWFELSGSSSGDFDALVDLIVKEQFINACSEELAVYLIERGPKDVVELTTWAQQYLIAHKQQLTTCLSWWPSCLDRGALVNVDSAGCGTSVVRGPTGHK